MRAHRLTARLGMALAGAVALTLAAVPAAAWEPTQQVKLIIHTAPGGDTDLFVREVAKHLDKMLPKGADPVNVPGAGGDRARRYVLDRKGNAHVLGAITPSNINNPILHGADYGAQDFTPVAIMGVTPLMVVVNAKSPYNTLKDLIDAARAKPGKVIQGGGDVGEVDSLYNALLTEAAGVQIAFTPFQSKGTVELLGRHIDLMMANPAQVLPYLRSGDMRILATNTRQADQPDIRTFEELGYNLPLLRQYRGFWMPPGVPKEARDYYIAKLKELADSEAFKTYLAKNSLVAEFVAGDELAAMLRTEEDAYRKLDEKLGLLKK